MRLEFDRWTWAAGCTIGASAAPPGPSGPAVSQWKVTDLGTLGGKLSTGMGIDNAGQVVGQSCSTADAEMHAFLYSHGSMLDLDTAATASAINGAGPS